MTTIQVPDRLNRNIGFINKETKTYHTVKDYSKREIFIHPKYKSAMGLSLWVINNYLKPNDVEYLCYTVLNFEKETFNAVISLKDFLTYGKEFKGLGKNSDLQIILPMHYWTRVYREKREMVIHENVSRM